MNWASLGAPDRRALKLGAATVFGLVFLVRGWPAWRSWRAEVRGSAAEVRARALEANTVLGHFPETLDTLEARTSRLVAMRPLLLTGDTPTAAASNLAALLGELGRQSMVRFDAVETRIDTTHTLPRVAVDAQALTDVAGLGSLLQSLEQGPTLLAVRRLMVRPQNIAAPATQVESLSIQLTVEGQAMVRPPRSAP
jgi:hypothetical protein